MLVDNEKVVVLTYTLNVSENNSEKTLVESTPDDEPIAFIYGLEGMLPKFEEAIKGKKIGDKYAVTISAEDGYGIYDADAKITLPKADFEIDGEFDHEFLVEGAIVPMVNDAGEEVDATLLKVTNKEVTLDLNHPLAGKVLHFEGEILNVREPLEEELKHGHAHGPDGTEEDEEFDFDEEEEDDFDDEDNA